MICTWRRLWSSYLLQTRPHDACLWHTSMEHRTILQGKVAITCSSNSGWKIAHPFFAVKTPFTLVHKPCTGGDGWRFCQVNTHALLRSQEKCPTISWHKRRSVQLSPVRKLSWASIIGSFSSMFWFHISLRGLKGSSQQLLNVWDDAQRVVRRGIALHRLSLLVQQELSEVPLDVFAAHEA